MSIEDLKEQIKEYFNEDSTSHKDEFTEAVYFLTKEYWFEQFKAQEQYLQKENAEWELAFKNMEQLVFEHKKALQEAQEQKPIWVKVNSESDLPTKDCRYWIANENGIFDFFANKNQIKRKFENKTLTHYKELEESLPPDEQPTQKPITDEEINTLGWIEWENDQKINPNPVNPHAFVYGYKIAFKAALNHK